MKEFNLSEKIVFNADWDEVDSILSKDVKEFIKRLKEELSGDDIYDKYELGQSDELIEFIDKLAGEELI